jgi:hypothetical protein
MLPSSCPPTLRSSLGVAAKTSRMVMLNCRTLAKPAANATSVMGRSVVSMRSLAVWARRARASASGPAPTSATSTRFRWRSVYERRRARPVTPSLSTTPSEISRIALATRSVLASHSGEPGTASGLHRLQARKPACWAAAAEG